MIDFLGQNIRFLPHFPITIIAGLAIFAAILLFVSRFRGGRILWRGVFFAVLFIYFLNPNIVNIVAEPKNDIVAILKDNSSSMRASNRVNGVNTATENLSKALKNYPNIEIKTIEINDAENGTKIDGALDEVFNNIPKEQIGGAIYIGDGQLIVENNNRRNYPIHQLIIGDENEIDRRIEIVDAPISTEIGQSAKYKIKTIQNGATEKNAKIFVYPGSEPPIEIDAKLNSETEIEVPIKARGKNNIAFEIMPAPNEISLANNAIVHQTIGIAQSLKVLLVTGEPYEGARAWRNLLKSDPNIDLVHFTILRGPEDEDDENFTPLSLIPFPTDELFFEHLSSFDLIVFDRFKRLDALPDFYMARVATWIENGGGFLFLAGPDEIDNNGILPTPLGRLMPFYGTPSPIDTEYKPVITQSGLKHPITKDFANIATAWGNWTSAVKFEANGEVLLSANGAPLLITSQIGKGRVGAILSDKSWLWQRGYKNGGPFRGLMARIIHWLLKDPELSQEKLMLSNKNGNLHISYFNTQYNSSIINLIGPNYNSNLELLPQQNGALEQTIHNADFGLYRAQIGNLVSNIIMGKTGETTKDLTATDQIISKYIGNSASKSAFIGKNANRSLPNFAPNKNIGFTPNNWAFKQNNFKDRKSITLKPIFPTWLWAFILALLAIIVWAIEGGLFSHKTQSQTRHAKASALD